MLFLDKIMIRGGIRASGSKEQLRKVGASRVTANSILAVVAHTFWQLPADDRP